jgi:flavin reductase (DIM6/NTAB) family NADH-FMN oxidoreductase RutF
MAYTDKDTFRHVIGHFASGVTVLTTRNGDEDFGATASAVSSLSLEPPMLLVCLNRRSSTQEAIHASGRLGVNILDEDQGIVAERFASPRGTDKFAGLNVQRGDGDVPQRQRAGGTASPCTAGKPDSAATSQAAAHTWPSRRQHERRRQAMWSTVDFVDSRVGAVRATPT